MKLLKLAAATLLLASLISCANFQSSDWEANIILPASQDCYGFKVMSGKETRRVNGSKECERIKHQGIILTSENYKLLKKDILDNCQFAACKQITGKIDSFFLILDSGLKKIPIN